MLDPSVNENEVIFLNTEFEHPINLTHSKMRLQPVISLYRNVIPWKYE